jgi:Permuted papain-like amidase enzyme, YaeF/YiiX, C92 family
MLGSAGIAMSAIDSFLDWLGRRIARRLTHAKSGYEPFTHSNNDLRRALQPGDVLLVAGNQRISEIIKYLTQSTWSHAAVYVGDALGPPAPGEEAKTLIEVELGEGCIASPLSKYSSFNTRICRPVGLSDEDRRKVVRFMVDHLGLKYDMRNILDLARYLFPVPPVPVPWRRQMIALGSGDPTRAICSTLMAQAFASIRYPVLPRIERRAFSRARNREILHIRHHSLYAPCDFDLSPYFQIVKPSIDVAFDHRQLVWAERRALADERSKGNGDQRKLKA